MISAIISVHVISSSGTLYKTLFVMIYLINTVYTSKQVGGRVWVPRFQKY